MEYGVLDIKEWEPYPYRMNRNDLFAVCGETGQEGRPLWEALKAGEPFKVEQPLGSSARTLASNVRIVFPSDIFYLGREVVWWHSNRWLIIPKEEL